jgi:hypothetical protein
VTVVHGEREEEGMVSGEREGKYVIDSLNRQILLKVNKILFFEKESKQNIE